MLVIPQDATTAQWQFLQLCIQWSSIVVLWYDYILTFEMEVKYMWRQRFRLSSALYICCRYALFDNVFCLLIVSNMLGNVCKPWYRVVVILSQFGRIAIIVTFTMRTYAVCNRNQYVLAYLSVLGAAIIITAFWNIPVEACHEMRSFLTNSLLAALMMVFETSAFILTTIRCVQTLYAHKGASGRGSGFFRLILDQGIVYFALTSTISIVTLVLNYGANRRGKPGICPQRLLGGFNIPLSCLLTARFLLHLRSYDEERINELDSDALISTIRFDRTQMTSIIADFGHDPMQLDNEKQEHNPLSSNA